MFMKEEYIERTLSMLVTTIDCDALQQMFKSGIFFIYYGHANYLQQQPFGSNQQTLKFENIRKLVSTASEHITTVHIDYPLIDNSSQKVVIGVYQDLNEPNYHPDAEKCLAFLLGIKEALQVALQLGKENEKNATFFELTKKLYSSIQVNDVLQIVYDTIHEHFAHFEAQIWLSHEYETLIPFKKISFRRNEHDQNIKAYLTGTTLMYEEDQLAAISAPLQGKQGIYGVLQFKYPLKERLIAEEERIRLLAEAAGSALENANLFQQSQRLIAQLQFINETTKLLSKTLDLDENINYLQARIQEIFNPEAIHMFIYLKGEKAYKMLASTTKHVQGQHFPLGEFPFIEKIHQSKEGMIISDVGQEISVLGNISVGQRSLLAVPMISNNAEIQGLIITTHSEANFFSYDDYRLLQTLVHHATLVLINSTLHQELNKMVITDNLTQLYARNFLDEKMYLSHQQDKRGAFILIDIDNFKTVNDTYGHQVGDDILIQVANVIQSSVRETDTAARWGGEELAIYLPNVNVNEAFKVAQRIRERVSRETSPRVTVSTGISYWDRQIGNPNSTPTVLFQRADQALYKAKQSGKNKVIVHLE